MNDEPFDPFKAGVALRRRYERQLGPELTLAGRCEVYAALYQGAPQAVVARAFELSSTTVSHIASCRDDSREPVTFEVEGHTETHMVPHLDRKRDPDRKRHYPDVAAESKDPWARMNSFALTIRAIPMRN